VITVTVTDGFTLKSIDAQCDNPDVAIQMTPVKAGAEYKVTVTPKARHAKAAISIISDVEGKGRKTVLARVRTS